MVRSDFRPSLLGLEENVPVPTSLINRSGGFNPYARRQRMTLDKGLQAIREMSCSEQNRLVALEYLKTKQSQVSLSRIDKIIGAMRLFLGRMKGDFSSISQDEVENMIIWINNRNDWQEWTKVTHLKIWKMFLLWLEDKYNLNLRLNKFKISRPKNKVMPEYLLSQEEFTKLMNATDDLQTKLFFGILYESGARVGEILGLKKQNVSFNTYGARLTVSGKTGQRVLPIIWYAGMLRQFLELHPYKEEKMPLWYMKLDSKVAPLSYEAIKMRLERLRKKAGISKRIYFHLLRHTRMTELAGELPEQTLKALAGWTGDSKMAATYVHLANKDVEESLLTKVYGIKVKDEEGKERLKVCPKCSETNPYFTKLCQRCKAPLDEKELRSAVISEEKAKEVEDWSKMFLAFLKVVEKKHPDIWEDMKEVAGSNLELPT